VTGDVFFDLTAPNPDDPYCDYCEEYGHAFHSCQRRDDEDPSYMEEDPDDD
jgi:hypothetical protein